MVGSAIALISAWTLAHQGSSLDLLWWRINPPARQNFLRLGRWAIPTLLVIAAAVGTAGVGLLRGARWAWFLTVGLLSVNLLGDLVRLVAISVFEGAVGVVGVSPVLFYLTRPRVRAFFKVNAKASRSERT